MPKDPSFDYYLDQEIEEHMKDEPEEKEEEEDDAGCDGFGLATGNPEEDDEYEKADMPRFKAYCKKNNLKVVDNKLVPCEDETDE